MRSQIRESIEELHKKIDVATHTKQSVIKGYDWVAVQIWADLFAYSEIQADVFRFQMFTICKSCHTTRVPLVWMEYISETP